MVGWPSGQRQQTVNLPASAYVGSNPTPTTIFCWADLAQQVEHIHGKDGVSGSSPEVGSIVQITPLRFLGIFHKAWRGFFFRDELKASYAITIIEIKENKFTKMKSKEVGYGWKLPIIPLSIFLLSSLATT